MQLAHHEIKNHKHEKEIILILENLRSPENIGLIIRTAEGMGVSRVIVISEKITALNQKMKKIARATEQYVRIDFYSNLATAVQQLEGYIFYALEKTSQSIDYRQGEVSYPCAIICGNEKAGVSAPALALCERYFHIPMYGKNTSLNVAVATAIFLASLMD